MSETCRVLHQINLRNSSSRWVSLQEYITMHGPLNVKFGVYAVSIGRVQGEMCSDVRCNCVCIYTLLAVSGSG